VVGVCVQSGVCSAVLVAGVCMCGACEKVLVGWCVALSSTWEVAIYL
jgi:hypothetical protein